MQTITRNYRVAHSLSVSTLTSLRLALYCRNGYSWGYSYKKVLVPASIGSSLLVIQQRQWHQWPYHQLQLEYGRRQFQSHVNIRQQNNTTWWKPKIYWKVRNPSVTPPGLLPQGKQQQQQQTERPSPWNLYKRLHSGIKWLLIRDKTRPFSKDERGTLFSWLVISQIMWIILKTTSVVSLLLLGFNTIFAKGLVAQSIGRLLSYFSSDVDIEFQDALIPEWKSGLIKFSNVKIRTRGSQKNNILCFNLQFHQIEINLNMKKWIHGNGIIEDVKVFGMRGQIIVNYPEQKVLSMSHTQPVTAKHGKSHVDDSDGYYHSLWRGELNRSSERAEPLLIGWFTNKNYILRHVSVRDSHFTLIERINGSQGKPLRYAISIFHLSISGLNFNHILVDFLKADVVTGSINNSLFSFHKRQHKLSYISGLKDDLSPWERITRLRLDSINVNELGLTDTSAFNWISDGTVGITADLMLPRETPDDDSDKYVVIDLKFEFKDLKAKLPAHDPKLSTGESILSVDELKPIVSFVNLRRLFANLKKNLDSGSHDSTVESGSTDGVNRISDSPQILSIKHKKSYPSVTVLPSKKGSRASGNRENVSIIRFHESKLDGGGDYLLFSDEILPYTAAKRLSEDPRKLVLHCRLVRNVKNLNQFVLFGETDIFDDLCMELYIDLLKTVEEWDLKNSDEWLRNWGASFGSQLLLFGFDNFL